MSNDNPSAVQLQAESLKSMLEMSPEDLSLTVKALVSEIESRRRSPQESVSSGPLDKIVDYSTAGNMIDIGVTHLDEGIPNGQKNRVESGFFLLQAGTILMGQWLRARGYEVSLYGKDN